MATRRYHHGDLRRALLDNAFELYEKRGDLDFSFRELARHSGVTHNAPYRHFVGKTELLAALMEEGLERLAVAERAALVVAGDDPRKRVQLLGEAYIRFAVSEPNVFRLVLSGKVDKNDDTNPPESESYRILHRAVAAAQKAGVARTDFSARELTLAAWAFVHGIASLLATGRVPSKEAAVHRYITILSTLYFEGAQAPKTEDARSGS